MITTEDVEAVLKRILRFDRVGVGARDLRECLMVQLWKSRSPPDLKEAPAHHGSASGIC
ncbi:hypothetical protein ACNKHW_20405 [Shigella flexneri]